LRTKKRFAIPGKARCATQLGVVRLGARRSRTRESAEKQRRRGSKDFLWKT